MEEATYGSSQEEDHTWTQTRSCPRSWKAGLRSPLHRKENPQISVGSEEGGEEGRQQPEARCEGA
jgi:hypothetical protein